MFFHKYEINYELRVTNYELRVTNYELQITNYGINYELRESITSYKLRITVLAPCYFILVS
ncbi:hypothetical protein CGC49_05930 [Capnocytophaga sp. H4358]|nr:hypothetical protein CGC49_05930 [Capnocytophaga sp. H4358]